MLRKESKLPILSALMRQSSLPSLSPTNYDHLYRTLADSMKRHEHNLYVRIKVTLAEKKAEKEWEYRHKKQMQSENKKHQHLEEMYSQRQKQIKDTIKREEAVQKATYDKAAAIRKQKRYKIFKDFNLLNYRTYHAYKMKASHTLPHRSSDHSHNYSDLINKRIRAEKDYSYNILSKSFYKFEYSHRRLNYMNQLRLYNVGRVDQRLKYTRYYLFEQEQNRQNKIIEKCVISLHNYEQRMEYIEKLRAKDLNYKAKRNEYKHTKAKMNCTVKSQKRISAIRYENNQLMERVKRAAKNRENFRQISQYKYDKTRVAERNNYENSLKQNEKVLKTKIAIVENTLYKQHRIDVFKKDMEEFHQRSLAESFLQMSKLTTDMSYIR